MTTLTASEPLQSPSPRSEWMAYVFSGIPGAILVLLAVRGVVSEDLAVVLFALSFVLLNLAHLAATWSRAYFSAESAGRAPVERILFPAVLLFAALAGEAVGGVAVLLTAQFFLSLHHATMENYGLVRYSQRRRTRRLETTQIQLDKAACVLLPIGALIWRLNTIENEFHTIALFSPPAWVGAVLGAAGLAAIGLWLSREWRAHRDGEHVDPLGIGVVLATNAMWTWLLLAIAHPHLPLFALASQHYIQHLYFVWHFERRSRPERTPLPSELRERVLPPSRLGWLVWMIGLGGSVVLLLTFASMGLRELAALAGLSAAGAAAIPPWTAAMIGVNFSHYWLDHRVWRLSKREVARPLALS